MKSVVTILLFLGMICGAAQSASGVEQGKVPVTTSSEKARKEFLLGQALSDNLQATKSLEHFDKAISLDPTFATAYLARAINSLTTKDFFANIKGAMKNKDHVSEGERLNILAVDAGANGNMASQRQYLERLVEQYPNDERARFTLGTYYFGQQEYSEAIAQFEKSIQLADKFAAAYNILGYAYRQVEQYDKAEKVFKKYTELIPNDPNPYDSYAELLLKMGRFDESIANYRKALVIDPSFTSSEIGLTMNYLYQGKSNLAAKKAQRLHDIARNDGEQRQAFFVEAVVDADGGYFASALRNFDKEYAVGEKIKDVGGMSGDLAAKGNVLLEMGRYDEANDAFQASAKKIAQSDFSSDIKKNTELFTHYNGARIAIARGDIKKGESETEMFRLGAEESKNPNLFRFAHELNGLLALAAKDGDKATTELLQANQLDPYNLYRISLAYDLKGDKAHAKEFCKKAAEFNSLPSLNYAFIRSKAVKMSSLL